MNPIEQELITYRCLRSEESLNEAALLFDAGYYTSPMEIIKLATHV
jgi:hypothetical protein